ncbi:hypothetical protein JCM19046_4873 [Bacillus sp. JCM 19046]|nr:hypothetical protein JCM19045_3719 [Bacillus sp. JCM 19045]GAF20167.1 hypothetical protein JCM19046_4873 [Bacillus sp. JCM 19046]
MTVLKTKEISEEIGVNPTTIQRWTKYFKISCDVNEQGHFLYKEEHIKLFKHIQRQLQEGKRLKEVTLTKKASTVPTVQYEAKLEKVFVQVHALEEKLATKADDVVSYQLLKHRSELDEMMKLLDQLETRLESIEQRYATEKQVVNEMQPLPRRFKNKTLKTIISFFTF